MSGPRRLAPSDLARLQPEAVEQRQRLQSSINDAALELAFLHSELKRRQYLADPVAWVEERLGAQLWSQQKRILESVRDRRRTAVRSSHEIGKSWLAAAATCWWVDAHPPGQAFVVTSAPSATQVRAILWREIGRMHAKGNLPGRLNTTEWKVPISVPVAHSVDGSRGTREELVAFGRKPDDYDPTAFQGIHAPYVLIILDEACGIPTSLYEAADSLIANDTSKALAIGNPDDPASEFARICTPGSGWNTIGISAFDSPNFTGEPMEKLVLSQLVGKRYVEEKRKKWAPTWRWNTEQTKVEPPHEGEEVTQAEMNEAVKGTNPLWQSKVLGQFPHVSSIGGLIPISWVQAAQNSDLSPKPNDLHYLGVDVGGGGDSSCGAERHGPVVRILWEDQNPDTMATCGNVVNALADTQAVRANVDGVGIGKGVVDRGVEMGLPFISIGTGEAPEDPEHFMNRRSELWWQVRELFENGLIDIDPTDEDLAAELCDIRFKRLSSGKIQLETKHDAKARGIPSPNRADALMLSFAEPALVEEEYAAVGPLW